MKNVSVSGGQCVVSNEQINASVDLKTVGQDGVIQVRCVKMRVCVGCDTGEMCEDEGVCGV